MKDDYGCPVVLKVTPGGNRCRVAFGPGTGEPVPPEGWELRITHPDNDYWWVTFHGIAPGFGWGEGEWERMSENPEAYWAEAEAALMAYYDKNVAEMSPDLRAEVAVVGND